MPRCATLTDDLRRLGMAIAGTYESRYEREQDGSKARKDDDGYFGELGHAIKNVWVEQFRRWSWATGWTWLNRGNKPQSECTYYEFPTKGEKMAARKKKTAKKKTTWKKTNARRTRKEQARLDEAERQQREALANDPANIREGAPALIEGPRPAKDPMGHHWQGKDGERVCEFCEKDENSQFAGWMCRAHRWTPAELAEMGY